MSNVVTGFPRSGTSMMMACLEAGGMKCHKSEARESLRLASRDEHYDPNPAGLYEPTIEELRTLDFGDAVVKVVIPWLGYASHIERAILMRRDPEEIRQSLQAFTGERLKPGWVDTYEDLLGYAKARLARGGASVLELNYMEVLDDPPAALRRVFDYGWPIDVRKAAAVVDPKQYRFRRELLTVGL